MARDVVLNEGFLRDASLCGWRELVFRDEPSLVPGGVAFNFSPSSALVADGDVRNFIRSSIGDGFLPLVAYPESKFFQFCIACIIDCVIIHDSNGAGIIRHSPSAWSSGVSAAIKGAAFRGECLGIPASVLGAHLHQIGRVASVWRCEGG